MKLRARSSSPARTREPPVTSAPYATSRRCPALGEGEGAEQPAAERRAYRDFASVQLAYQLNAASIHEPIRYRLPSGEFVNTTVGRVLFNEIVPEELGFQNVTMDKKRLRELVSTTHREVSPEATVLLVDAIKDIGFRYATQSGTTIAVSDIVVPKDKPALIAQAAAISPLKT